MSHLNATSRNNNDNINDSSSNNNNSNMQIYVQFIQGEDTGATPPASLMLLCLASHLPYEYFSYRNYQFFESLEERLPYEVFASFLPPPLF